MKPSFGDVVTFIGGGGPWVVLGPTTSDFTHIDDVGDEHNYLAGRHWAIIRLGAPNFPGEGMTMGMGADRLQPYEFPKRTHKED